MLDTTISGRIAGVYGVLVPIAIFRAAPERVQTEFQSFLRALRARINLLYLKAIPYFIVEKKVIKGREGVSWGKFTARL